VGQPGLCNFARKFQKIQLKKFSEHQLEIEKALGIYQLLAPKHGLIALTKMSKAVRK